ncbi:hypothetical protein Dsin_030817 [Dipteronia sinensis]|uniref:Reverse transcriptase domain-containing protein n=1 Tax=Dipteronia sinensis TaxID=43782 RepID=A0AAD9ZJV3_9ROSI|nr:hypothetical protein Dsin_030817 [Dipteronia sinensis]
MEDFRNALDPCELEDMGFWGSPFTWTNRQSGDFRRSWSYGQMARMIKKCTKVFSGWNSNNRISLRTKIQEQQRDLRRVTSQEQLGDWKAEKPSTVDVASVLDCLEQQLSHQLRVFFWSLLSQLRRSRAVKLEMSKAYDRVEWDFLAKGSSTFKGSQTRGPLSPYLYLLVAEGLSSMIQSSVLRGEYSSFRCIQSGPIISHLFFADDSILFSNVATNDCVEIRRILDVYSWASGPRVNLDKSGNYLCNTTSHQEEIKEEDEDFPRDNQARHDHLSLQLNDENCKSKTNNFNLMAIVHTLEKKRDEALKEVEVKSEMIKCQEKKMVEDAHVLENLINYFANYLFFLKETIKGNEEELEIMKTNELGILHRDASDLGFVDEQVESPTTKIKSLRNKKISKANSSKVKSKIKKRKDPSTSFGDAVHKGLEHDV